MKRAAITSYRAFRNALRVSFPLSEQLQSSAETSVTFEEIATVSKFIDSTANKCQELGVTYEHVLRQETDNTLAVIPGLTKKVNAWWRPGTAGWLCLAVPTLPTTVIVFHEGFSLNGFVAWGFATACCAAVTLPAQRYERADLFKKAIKRRFILQRITELRQSQSSCQSDVKHAKN